MLSRSSWSNELGGSTSSILQAHAIVLQAAFGRCLSAPQSWNRRPSRNNLAGPTGPEAVTNVDNFKVTTILTNVGDETLHLLNDPASSLISSNADSFRITNSNVSAAYNFTSSGEDVYDIEASNKFFVVDPATLEVSRIYAKQELPIRRNSLELSLLRAALPLWPNELTSMAATVPISPIHAIPAALTYANYARE
ncbi:hypothetical protein D9758_012963 [Tetrapyrgos nigripes]|uniref:Uncharacterized protein n=1 Tax=Tetrapyrgos nigripes TaxID=182062 RepID=A0A8H5FNQ5_9AGAR|nr:hypothetical protein D9758_012963 [Tetrapyrgos nigripes]